MIPEEYLKQGGTLTNGQIPTQKIVPGQEITPIAVDSLSQKQTPVDVGTPVVPTDTYSSILAQGTAAINGTDTTTPSSSDTLTELMKSLGTPPSQADAYTETQKSTDILAKQDLVAKNKQKVSVLTAQLKGITDKQNADILQAQKDAGGKGITTGGFQSTQSAINRDAAIAALPLNSQILAAQAELTGSQETLALAQQQLDTVFKLRSEDAKNLYDYKTNFVNQLFTIADKKQTEAIQAKQQENTRNFSLLTDAINNAQALSKTAGDNGSSDIASQIAQIPHPDFNSKTLTQDIADYNAKVATLQAKVVPKVSLPVSAEEYNFAVSKGYTGTYTQYQNEDSNRKIAQAKALNASGLDNQTLIRVQAIAGQFDNEVSVKSYQQAAEAGSFLQSLDNLGTSADNIGAIYAFAKIMDPNSVVREGEYATVQKYAQALWEKFGLSAKRVFDNSNFLTQEAVKNMKETVNKKVSAAEKNFKNIYDEYGRRINKVTGKTDGTDWITDYSKGFPTSNTPSGSGSVETLDTQVVNGVTYKKDTDGLYYPQTTNTSETPKKPAPVISDISSGYKQPFTFNFFK